MQYAIISPTNLVYPTHPGPIIILDGTTAHVNSNTRITHTTEVHLFREVMGLKQALVQKIVGTVKEAYLVNICNRTMNSINDTVAGIITHLQEKYSQLMPHKLLEREIIIKKMIYNPNEPITTVFSIVKELLNFTDIMGTLYTELQDANIACVILHLTGKFGLAICDWNPMLEIQKTWDRFKQFFLTSHREMRDTSDITIKDTGMHHANMVHYVVAELQEALQQDQTQMETLTNMQAPVDNMSNVVQSTQQQLDTQLHQMQSMM